MKNGLVYLPGSKLDALYGLAEKGVVTIFQATIHYSDAEEFDKLHHYLVKQNNRIPVQTDIPMQVTDPETGLKMWVQNPTYNPFGHVKEDLTESIPVSFMEEAYEKGALIGFRLGHQLDVGVESAGFIIGGEDGSLIDGYSLEGGVFSYSELSHKFQNILKEVLIILQ